MFELAHYYCAFLPVSSLVNVSFIFVVYCLSSLSFNSVELLLSEFCFLARRKTQL